MMYCEKMFPLSALSALKLRTFCTLRQQCYKDLTKSEKNRGKGLEESLKEFIKGKFIEFSLPKLKAEASLFDKNLFSSTKFKFSLNWRTRPISDFQSFP